MLPLDSLLAWSWMQQHHPEAFVTSRSTISSESFIEPDLPLARRGYGEEWYWAASYACGIPLGEHSQYWHKRFDAQDAERYVDFGKHKGTVQTGEGRYKGYRVPLTVFLIPKLEWFAVGDMDGVSALVWRITHLGKKGSQGYGAVRRWTVEPWSEDLSGLRPVPDEAGTEQSPIRPPYWLNTNNVIVRWPEDGRLACRAIPGL